MKPEEITTLMQSELTAEQAVALSDSGWWEVVGSVQASLLQLNQERLCFPSMSLFKKCVSEATGRPVYTHEFSTQGVDSLKAEIISKNN